MPDVINKVISFISGDGEGTSDKDILLKQLVKDLSQNKYAKFYRVRQGEFDPSFAQYIFNVYRLIYPLQIFLKDPSREAKIKQITLEAFLDKQVMALIKRISPEGIAERKKTAGTDLPKQLQEDLALLAAGFDSPRIAAADKCYDLLVLIKQFAFFNFYSFLKKFDSDLVDGDFTNQPKFNAVEASVAAPDLAAFLSVLPLTNDEADWKTVFEILKYCKGGVELIPLIQWNSLITSLKEIKQSKIFEIMGRLATGNPIWEIKPAILQYDNLSAAFLEQISSEVRGVIAGIAGSQKSAQISALVNAIFNTPTVVRLNFYTPDKGVVYTDKDLYGFDYAPALNHLSAYIQEFMGKEINELCDVLLVRGQWTNNAASRQMSEGFHTVMDILPEINELDATLDEGGSNGPRLRGALLRVDRDKTQTRYINSIINSINEDALDMLNRSVPALIIVGKHFKMLMYDFEKKHPELMMNWKELALTSKVPLIQRISDAYKKINYFVQLMLLETRVEE